MKKSGILFLAVLLFGATNLQAQSIELRYVGNQLSNGEKVAIIGDPELADMAIELDVTNISGSTMEISCQRYEMDTISNSSIFMCWANCTTQPNGGIVTLEPGETAELFGAHCGPNGGFGTENNLYTFYDINNPTDTISFSAIFSTTSHLIENDEEEAMFFESIEFWGTPNEEISFQIPAIRNITDDPINIRVEQHITELTDGAEISFEWGGFHYQDENISDIAVLPAQELNDSFNSRYTSNSFGISRIKYVFYEDMNMENQQTIEFVFNTTSVGNSKITSFVAHQAFPNPSYGNLQINYKLQNNIKYANIEIFDLQSRQVHNQKLSTLSDKIEISLPSGTYFYRFTTSAGISETVKFIVI